MSTDSVSNALYMYMNTSIDPLIIASVREYYQRYRSLNQVSRKLGIDHTTVHRCLVQLHLI
jgi:DNA-binding phage protein